MSRKPHDPSERASEVLRRLAWPDDTHLIETIDQIGDVRPDIRSRFTNAIAQASAADPTLRLEDPFAPPTETTEGIEIGSGLLGDTTGPATRIPFRALDQHVVVLGATGVGKSVLVRHLLSGLKHQDVNTLVFDLENEYSSMLSCMPERDVLLVDAEDLRISLTAPPKGCKPTEWTDRLLEVLRETLFLRDGSIALLRRVLQRSNQTSRFPSVARLRELIDHEEKTCRGREREYIGSLKNRLDGLSAQLRLIFDCSSGMDLQQVLASRLAVIQMRNLAQESQLLLSMFLLQWFSTYLETKGATVRHLFVLEEVSRLIASHSRYDLGELLLLRQIRTARKRGIGFVLVDQTPSELPVVLTANTGTKICFRLADGRDIRAASESMNLTADQRVELGRLGPRVAVLRCLETDPHRFQVPQLDFRPSAPETTLAARSRSLGILGWSPERPACEVGRSSHPDTPRPESTAHSAPPLRKQELDVLCDLAQEPMVQMTRRTERLGLSAQKMGAIRRELEKRKLIRVVRINPGRGRGSAFHLWELTSTGRQLASSYGVRPKQGMGRGGLCHQWWSVCIHEWAKQQPWVSRVAIEESRNGKAVDVGIYVGSRSIAVEAALSTGLAGDQEVRNVTRDSKARFDVVVVLCQSARDVNRVGVLLRQSMSANPVRVGLLAQFREILDEVHRSLVGDSLDSDFSDTVPL